MKTKLLKSLLPLLLFAAACLPLGAQRLSRELNVDLWTNQAGYVPGAAKTVVTKGVKNLSPLPNRKFEVIHLESQQVAFEGRFTPSTCDFGDYAVGDFSALTQEGHYYIKSDTLRSWPFQISGTVYRTPMELLVGYFSLQRCGASATGYLSPCHLDDGVRLDNGKHQDVSGGWHDATDLRKWVSATIYGMIGLSRTYELLDAADPAREKILDELLWGNRYFLNMQEPAGYVMHHIGGEVEKGFDSNRWTDNEIGEEGGERRFVRPTTGDLAAADNDEVELLIFGTKDDRIIQTKPADIISQYHFVQSEVAMSRITKSSDPAYSDRCLQAAIRCFEWCKNADREPKAGVLGASIQAAIELYKATGRAAYRDVAVLNASTLRGLQAGSRFNQSGGFFYTSYSNHEPYRTSFQVHLELIALCDLVQALPRHASASAWKQMISNYSVQYLSFFSQKNSFGLVPYGLYTAEDPDGNRRSGTYWYRYFMNPRGWFHGVNPYITPAAIGLMKAAAILDNPALKAIAQRQLDWIIGANPFSVSTIVGVGHNQLPPMDGSISFRPATPVLPGAVMNGLCGNGEDRPYMIPYDTFNDREYWTPAVACTLWLMAEITMKN